MSDVASSISHHYTHTRIGCHNTFYQPDMAREIPMHTYQNPALTEPVCRRGRRADGRISV